MKTTRKALTLMMALALILSLAVPVFATAPAAADSTYTLTINNSASGHTYEAYQIFSGNLETTAQGTQVLTKIEWGAAISDGAALLNEIKATAAAASQTSELYKLKDVKNAADLADAIADNITSDSASLAALAEIFAKYLAAGSASGTSTYANSKYTISGLPAGYYLVKDKDNSLNGDNASYTKFILRVLKDENVVPKSDLPTIDKTISDNSDNGFGEYEDFDINDTAYYKWEATLPSNIADYETYYMQFNDKLPTGLKFMRFESIYLLDSHGNTVAHELYKNASDKVDEFTLPAGIVADGTDTQEFTLTISNLLALTNSAKPGYKLVVIYSTRISREALIAEPNTNAVYLEFSNDPNWNGEGTEPTGETPEDVAHAFTFKIDIDKYDSDNQDLKLEGAEFILYFETAQNDVTTYHYAKVITEEMVAAGEKVNGIVSQPEHVGVVYGWTTERSEASVLDTDANGSINLRGLDEGTYYLEETKAPAGYNLMETRVQVDIEPTYTESADTVTVEVTYKVDNRVNTNGSTVGIRNSSGSTLPQTGGIGTTLFYIFGGFMAVGAAVLLVTKKRMSAEA